MQVCKLDQSQGTATGLLEASACTEKSIKLYFKSLSLTKKTNPTPQNQRIFKKDVKMSLNYCMSPVN